MEAIVEKLNTQTNFPIIVREMNELWKAEQRKRKEFYELIHEDTKAEFINGVVIFQSPVKNKHWVACTNLAAYLTVYVNQHKLGRVGVEKVLIRCTRNDYEPDIVFFGNEKANAFTPNQMLFPVPDLAVEVLSDSTWDRDYGVKFEDYAQHGITEYWIINTDEQSVEQYKLNNGEYKLHQKLTQSGLLKSFVVVGFEIEISHIFS